MTELSDKLSDKLSRGKKADGAAPAASDEIQWDAQQREAIEAYVQSQRGVGTTFRVLLPQARALPSSTSQEAPRALTLAPATVLLVDDEVAVRSVAKRILEAASCAVLEASDWRQAIKLFSRVADLGAVRCRGGQTRRTTRHLSP